MSDIFSQPTKVKIPGLPHWQVSMLTGSVSGARAEATASPSPSPSQDTQVCYNSWHQKVPCEGAWPRSVRIVAVVLIALVVLWFIYAIFRLRKQTIERRTLTEETGTGTRSPRAHVDAIRLPMPVTSVSRPPSSGSGRLWFKKLAKPQSSSAFRMQNSNLSDVTLVGPEPAYLIKKSKVTVV